MFCLKSGENRGLLISETKVLKRQKNVSRETFKCGKCEIWRWCKVILLKRYFF